MKLTDLPQQPETPYYTAYLRHVGEDTLLESLEISLHEFIHFVREIPLGKHDYRYAEGKWTIKDIIQHLIDAERIFSYRALRIARGDKTPLPGFDEDFYVDQAKADRRSLQSLLEELSLVRHSTMQLFKSFDSDMAQRTGFASGREIQCAAIGFVIVGHMIHHRRVFAERYMD